MLQDWACACSGRSTERWLTEVAVSCSSVLRLPSPTTLPQPDVLKDTLERIEKEVIESFDDEDRRYFDQVFGFFNRITSISGALKPYIKRPKAERKVRTAPPCAFGERWAAVEAERAVAGRRDAAATPRTAGQDRRGACPDLRRAGRVPALQSVQQSARH